MNHDQQQTTRLNSAEKGPAVRLFRLVVATVAAVLTAFIASGCSVTAVDPVLPKREITMLCLDHNPDAGADYDSDISALLDTMGMKNRMTGGAFPGECPHRLQTRVSWSNSLIPFVVALELVITEGNRPLGDASYQVGQAYRTPERFGSAASKAKPLLEKLLVEYDKSASKKSTKKNTGTSNRTD